ncbi:hypothetical protein BC826DRAFT_982827, partial [Russula brevipes]
YHQSLPCSPPKEGHLDADERRAAASLCYGSLPQVRVRSWGIQSWRIEVAHCYHYIVVASAVHLFRISKFDEVHFGKFASRYIKTRYFVNVRPPLAKLFITLVTILSGYARGYDGNFDFAEIAK